MRRPYFRSSGQLEEEEPELRICHGRRSKKEIHVQIMGEIQMEILKSLIAERFGIVCRNSASGASSTGRRS